jgi:hypothetical protein
MTKLIIVPDSYFEAPRFRKRKKFLCLLGVDCKRLFYVDMRALSQALTRERIVSLGWGRDVHDVRPAYTEHFCDVTEISPNGKTLMKLARHEFLAVTDRNNFAIGNPPDLRGMRIGNFAAANNSYLKHSAFSLDSF